jgi:hypothetical protein
MRRLNVPDLARMNRWLCGPEVVQSDGTIMSWSNPENPGYPYPEAAGLWLSTYPWLCSLTHIEEVEELREIGRLVADRLVDSIDASGGLGRDERVYMFDASIGLSGLLRYQEQERQWAGHLPKDLNSGVERLHEYVVSCLERRVGAEPPSEGLEERWSLRFGPHLMKSLLGLLLYARHKKRALPLVACDRIEDLAEASIGSTSGSDPAYVHALCYALEGLWMSSTVSDTRPDARIQSSLEMLAEVQTSNGGIPAYVHDGQGLGPCRVDATAQAIRLWILTGPEIYASEITRAVCFLQSMQAPSGGMRYQEDSDDINTWATLFAAQAVDWYLRDSPCVESIL